MNFVLISPHFPKNYEPFAHRLKANGFNTLGIGDAPYDALSDGLRYALTEYYRVDNMNDYDQLYRAVAYFAHKYGRIDRIESHNEFWLETDARLRTDFNVRGLKTEDMNRLKTKSSMKEVFRAHNIPVAKGRVFTDITDAQKLVSELGYPVVVKPDNGVGASDTYKINNEEELADFFTTKRPHVSYIMEEYIPGDIVTFDGLTDQDGNIVFYSTIVHNHTLLDIVSQGSDMYYYMPREIPKDLVALGKKCVAAFGIKERFFHFEFFRLAADQSLMALEINCRPPGGLSIDMFNYANDFDIFNNYATIVRDNRMYTEAAHAYYCAYVSRKGDQYRHTLDDVRRKFGDSIVNVQHMPGAFANIMGDVGVVFRTPSFEALGDMIRYTQEKR